MRRINRKWRHRQETMVSKSANTYHQLVARCIMYRRCSVQTQVWHVVYSAFTTHHAPPICVCASATIRRFHIGLLAVMMPLIIILWETWYWRCPLWGTEGEGTSMCIICLHYTLCTLIKSCIMYQIQGKNCVLAEGECWCHTPDRMQFTPHSWY